MLTLSLEERLEDQLGHAGDVLAEGELPLTENLLQRLGRLLKAEIALIQPNGQLGPSTLGQDSELRASLTDRWHSGLQEGTTTFIQKRSTPFLVVTRTLPKARDSRYLAVAVAASLGDAREAGRRAAWWLGAAALLGILILAWVGHRIALSITQPMQELARMADRITAGDRTVRMHFSHAKELNVLADALNTMAQRLQVYEQEIAEQNRLAALGSMGARIAHEIRNPLTAIKLELQLLSESLPDQQRAMAGSLLDEVRRLELIAASALQAGQGTHLSLKSTDLNSPVCEVAQLFKTQFKHRGIQLETISEDTLPGILVDPDRVKQILVNLLVNAGDALVEGGVIRVGTGKNTVENELFFWVEDSGPGIPIEHRATLFSGTNSSKPGGLGIGLKLSKELVELQGGQIQVEESSLGGARFVVRFPMENKQ